MYAACNVSGLITSYQIKRYKKQSWNLLHASRNVFVKVHLPNGSSVSIDTRPRDGRPGFNSRQGQRWNFATASRPAMGPTQVAIQRVKGGSYPGGRAARA